MAALAAIIVFIQHCHHRVTQQTIHWNSNLPFIKPNKNKHFSRDSNSKTKDRHYRKFTSFDQNGNPFHEHSNHNQPVQQKPISAKMAYHLLQILWSKNHENKEILLQKTQKDSASLSNELEFRYRNDLNRSREFDPNDSNAWFSLPGFRYKDWFAIKRYRDKLGGFCNSQQVLEIKELDSFWKRRIISKDILGKPQQPYRTISARSTWKELYQHPYVGPAYARILYYYYQQHPLPDCDEIKNLQGLPDSQLNRLLPYLSKNCKD